MTSSNESITPEPHVGVAICERSVQDRQTRKFKDGYLQASVRAGMSDDEGTRDPSSTLMSVSYVVVFLGGTQLLGGRISM